MGSDDKIKREALKRALSVRPIAMSNKRPAHFFPKITLSKLYSNTTAPSGERKQNSKKIQCLARITCDQRPFIG